MSRASKAWLIQGDEPPVVPLGKGDGLLHAIAIFMASRGLDKAICHSGPSAEGESTALGYPARNGLPTTAGLTDPLRA